MRASSARRLRCASAGASLFLGYRFSQQIYQSIIDTRHSKFRLLTKRVANVKWPLMGVVIHDHNGEPELVLLVHPHDDFVAGHGHGGLPFGAAFDLNVVTSA